MLDELEDRGDGSASAATDDHPSRRDRRADKPRRSRLRKVLLALLALLLLLGVGAAGFVGFLASTVSSNVQTEKMLGADATAPDGTTLPAPPAKAPGVNILLIGSDLASGGVSRSDVIVLAHIPENRQYVHLIHFPRDMYVDIPGHGKNKINASFAYGGAPLLVKTLEGMLKVPIDHVAKTDFAGFVGMTDALGGVRVYAEEASNGTGNGGPVVIKQGWNDLNGDQALGFVRERYTLSKGDLSRGLRQMAWIKAILLKATSRETLTNPAAIARFADASTRNLVVDETLTGEVARDLAFSLRGLSPSKVAFVTAPISGFAMDKTAGAIDVVDRVGMADLAKNLRDDTMADYAGGAVKP